MKEISEKNPINAKSLGKAKLFQVGNTRSNFQSTRLPLSAEKQLTIQQLKTFKIDEEVCKALQSSELLDAAGLEYITQYEAKEIAEILHVKIGKVIPAKFKDRVKLFLKSIQSTEGSCCIQSLLKLKFDFCFLIHIHH